MNRSLEVCYCGRPLELMGESEMCAKCRHIPYICDCSSKVPKTALCSCGHAKSEHRTFELDRTNQGFGFGNGGGQGARPTICAKCDPMRADHGFMLAAQQKAFRVALGLEQ